MDTTPIILVVQRIFDGRVDGWPSWGVLDHANIG